MRRVTGVFFGIVIVAMAAGCGGGQSSSHASSCGYIYSVDLPGGETKNLGGCSGTLYASEAPSVTVDKGRQITLKTMKEADGNVVASLPKVSDKSALSVVRRNKKEGLLVVRGSARGEGELVAHTTCYDDPEHSRRLSSCPVLHIKVR